MKYLPHDIGNMTALRTLKCCGNARVNSLPKSICRAQKLTLIEVDGDNFIYPPSEVVKQGTEIIIKYICDGKHNFCIRYI